MRATLTAILILALAACGAKTEAPPASPVTAPEPAVAPEPAPLVVTPAIQAIVDAPDRSADDRALDAGRHPAETLAFLGIAPGMRVAELFVGGGYTSELLARAVGPQGVVYAQNNARVNGFVGPVWGARLQTPAMRNVVRVDRELDAPLPPEATNLDVVLMNLVYHDTYWMKVDRAKALSKRRRSVARELVKRVQAELGELAMEKTRFEVLFTPADPEAALDPSAWTEQGLERAEFLLSPNPGEELRPLARIASGGELSRIMLALKSVVRSDAAGLTLVFDEVDAGIGGGVAEVVGRKLKTLAERQQVLCVTHLPQIAALADHHLAVRKQLARGRTQTGVDALSEPDRVEEVARMLGGETVTATARLHAREMLKQNRRQ